MNRTLRFIADAVSGILVGDETLPVYSVATDTRTLMQDCLFVPLIGDTYDGHTFVSQAIKNSASAFLWQEDRTLPPDLQDFAHIIVPDTLRALQNLAYAYRKSLAPGACLVQAM